MTDRTFTRWILVALISFFVASLLGVLLRYAFVWELPEGILYKHLQHAHSHVAMMGWLYSALYILIVRCFKLSGKIYGFLFWSTQLTVLGMLISFPIQGYGLFSIIFTSGHMILSYVFILRVFHDLKFKYSYRIPSVLLLKSALLLLFISTLGTWALGAIMNSPLKGTAWYYGAIQFFLHFQFNGWFVFAMLAVFFRFLENRDIQIPSRGFRSFYFLLVLSCVLTFALAVTWSTPDSFIFWINSLGVVLQVFVLIAFWLLLKKIVFLLRAKTESWTFQLWKIVFSLLSLKIVIQALVAIPYLAVVSYTIRNFIIGFIHLLMLGVLSVFIMGMIYELRSVSHRVEKPATYLFFVAFLSTELLLFIQGLRLWFNAGFMPRYDEMILIASIFFPVAIILYIYAIKRSADLEPYNLP